MFFWFSGFGETTLARPFWWNGIEKVWPIRQTFFWPIPLSNAQAAPCFFRNFSAGLFDFFNNGGVFQAQLSNSKIDARPLNQLNGKQADRSGEKFHIEIENKNRCRLVAAGWRRTMRLNPAAGCSQWVLSRRRENRVLIRNQWFSTTELVASGRLTSKRSTLEI